jgi:K+-sensing histidine kinase KdpD
MAKEFRSAALHYVVAVAAVAAASGVRAALHPTPGVYSPIFAPFILAIVVAGWLGGRGPSLVAAACSVLAVWYFFSGPSHSFAIANSAHLAGLARFALVCVLVSLLVGQLRASQARPPAVSGTCASRRSARRLAYGPGRWGPPA